jgi:hypothetical protein
VAWGVLVTFLDVIHPFISLCGCHLSPTSIHQSVLPCIHAFIHPAVVYLGTDFCIDLCIRLESMHLQSGHAFVHPSTHRSVCPSTYVSITYLITELCVSHLPIFPWFQLHVYLCIDHRSLFVHESICQSMY